MSDARALIMALPNPVILIGAEGRTTGVNDAARRLIGTDPNGRHYITALRQPALLDVVEASLKDGGHRHARYLGSDGSRDTTWDVTISGVMLSDGLTVVLCFEDRTAVEDAGEMRRDFVANVSHELRTPLTSMMGFIETLRGPARNDTAAQDRFLGIMEQEAHRMHALVEDLLSLSRVEDQERIRPTDPVPLQPLIAEVIDTLKPAASERGVEIVTNFPTAPIDVPGDHGQLWQLTRNLIENAIKYGGANRTVTLRLSAPAHEAALMETGIRFSVSDEGDGIPAHHIARLTERFYRVDSHRNRDVGGTGLGLAIVKHIINRHRGRLRVESEMGQGSVFTVILPILPAAPAE